MHLIFGEVSLLSIADTSARLFRLVPSKGLLAHDHAEGNIAVDILFDNQLVLCKQSWTI